MECRLRRFMPRLFEFGVGEMLEYRLLLARTGPVEIAFTLHIVTNARRGAECGRSDG
jgi:hypothetical protein